MAGNTPGTAAEKAPQSGFINGLVEQGRGAAEDMRRNYNDMKEANTINADRYFHCKANCQAAERGPLGAAVATGISHLREFQNLVEGDTAMDRGYDQYANRFGRASPSRTDFKSCEASCEPFAPRVLEPKYRSKP